MKEVKVNYQKMKENESNLRTMKNEGIKKKKSRQMKENVGE